HYSPAGSTIRVLLSQNEAETTQIVVENTGIEIPAEHLPKLFDRFYRADPSRRQQGAGTGLGLAIVQSIVQAHGGQITVTSNAGITRFKITLPPGVTSSDH
ncbi:MAG: GHKL domain-containing protein, partial [Immundisolibacteraceae bacterium]|nr:GHKL domain-containing protein [Immundisolibacteraceae bacterium]